MTINENLYTLDEYSYIDVGTYLVTIVTPSDYFDMDDEDLFTKISITKDGQEIFKKEYKEVSFHFIYKIKKDQ